jgi:hypothetical protein
MSELRKRFSFWRISFTDTLRSFMASSSFPPAVTPDEPEGDLAKEKAGRKDTNPPIELSRFRLGSAPRADQKRPG